MKWAYYIKFFLPLNLKVAIGKEGYLLIRKENHLRLFFFRVEKLGGFWGGSFFPFSLLRLILIVVYYRPYQSLRMTSQSLLTVNRVYGRKK
jgi:hypothetical protein